LQAVGAFGFARTGGGLWLALGVPCASAVVEKQMATRVINVRIILPCASSWIS
jgi:hypothetical protein